VRVLEVLSFSYKAAVAATPDLLDPYGAKCWPDGKERRAKGQLKSPTTGAASTPPSL
jgi:hypothetical protein